MDRLKRYPRSIPIQILVGIAVLISIGYISLFIGLSAMRSVYPFELEWIEGASVDEINWILQGKSVYGEPSISFIPSMKTPLFFYFSAGLAKIFGVGFFASRLLSILSSLGIFVLVYLIVRQTGADFAGGMLASGLVAASFRFTGAWMDLAKTDALCMFLLLAGFYVEQRFPDRKGWIFSSLLYILAYFTKQLALVVIILICLSSLVDTRGRSWVRWLMIGLAGYVVFVTYDLATNGWFSFYTVDILQYHNWQGALSVFLQRFLKNLWPAVIVILGYIAISFRQLTADRFSGKNWTPLYLSASLIIASGSVFLKSWTYDNGYIPAVIGMAIMTGIGFNSLAQDHPISIQKNVHNHVRIGGIVLVLVQFGLFFYHPIQQLPTAADKKAGQDFVNLLDNMPEKVLVFNHGYYNYLAGKASYLHSSWIGDVTASSAQTENPADAQRGKMVVNVLSQAVSDQYFDRIIVDKHPDQFLPFYFSASELIFPGEAVFYPITGVRSRPSSILVRNPVSSGGSFSLTDTSYSKLLGEGWKVENNTAYSFGEESVIQIALEQEHDYAMKLQLTPVCLTNQPMVSSISTRWNGQLLRTDPIDSCGTLELLFDLKRGSIEKKWNQLVFSIAIPAGSLTENRTVPTYNATFQKLAFEQR